MKFRRLGVILSLCLLAGTSVQASWFKEKDLIQTGVYYYPEHWDESQWERDFERMHELGFEFTHFAEFAWHNWSRRKDGLILPGLTRPSDWQRSTI